MKALTAILALGLISCGQTATTADTDAVDSIKIDKVSTVKTTTPDDAYNSNIYDLYVNPQLKTYLDKTFKGWTFPAPDRWDTVWFNQYKNEVNLVNYVTGDFDCNNQKDFAILFKKADGVIAAYAFISLGKSFQAFELIDFGKDSDEQLEFGLELLPPGKYNYMDPESDEAPSVKIKCNAVQILNFEKGAETFYWEKGKVKSIMTGD